MGYEQLFSTFFLIVSHVFIIPTLIWTWNRKKRLWIEFGIISLIAIWSLSYHICYQTSYCMFEKLDHRTLDHYFAQLCVPITVFYIFCIDKLYVKGLFFIFTTQIDFVFISFFGVHIYPKIALLISCFSLAIVYIIIRKCVYKKQIFRHFDLLDATFGVMLCFFGYLLLEKVDINTKHYAFLHSIWHLLSFSGSFFIFESRNPKKVLMLPTETWIYWDKCLRKHYYIKRNWNSSSSSPSEPSTLSEESV